MKRESCSIFNKSLSKSTNNNVKTWTEPKSENYPKSLKSKFGLFAPLTWFLDLPYPPPPSALESWAGGGTEAVTVIGPRGLGGL